MTAIAETLATPGLLPGVPPASLKATARYWRLQRLMPGEPLFSQGAPADALGLLLEGELQAEAEGVVIATIPSGELVGEISAFLSRATRSATVVATQPSSLLMLRSASLLGLRRRGNAVYGALLERALLTSCERVARTSERIVQGMAVLRDPTLEPPTPSVEREPERTQAPAPPLRPLLRSLPGLRRAPESQLAVLEAAFEAVRVRRGESIVVQGRSGDAAYLVGQGRISVQRNLDVDTCTELTVLGPGAPFGFNALIDKQRRMASCVALEGGWVFRMSQQVYLGLSGATRIAWQEALLATLAAQLRISNSLAAGSPTALVGDLQLPVTDFGRLLQAGGALEGLDTDEQPVGPASAADPLARAPILPGPRDPS